MKRFLPLLASTALLSSLSAAELPAKVYPGICDASGNLLPSVAPYLGQETRSLTLTVEPELLKKRNNFGYSEEEIKRYFSTPVELTLDETGMDKSFIKPVPAPFIHPRVIFNPEDLPAIRNRLANTQAGRAANTAIRAHIQEILTGPKAKFAADYEALASGKLVENLDPNVPYTLMYEAFRCLVDDDQAAGKKVAAAIATFSQLTQRELDRNLANPRNAGSRNDARVISQGPSREFTLGLDYDFAYKFMSEPQRTAVRKVLANCTAGMTGIGCEMLRTLHSGTSNWISWGCRALFAICAIEGEPGYDAGTYQRFANAQMNFIASMYPTGEAFEGWGKNFMFLEHLVIIAKRNGNSNLLGATQVRNAYNNYFLSSMTPWGNSFTFCDSLASSGCKIARNADVLMYHALFPKDVCGDFVYRNQIAENYDNVGVRTLNTHHPFSVMDTLCCGIFATDINPGSRDEEFAWVTKDRPLSYFCDETCNMMTRSGWEPNALYLNYLNRAIPGGHQYCDRSHFSLYGQGRFWSIYHGARQIHEQYMPNLRSVLLADDQGPSTAEAKCVGLTDTALATFEATDLSNPWNYQTAGLVKPAKGVPTVPKTLSYNDFRLHPSAAPWMSLPIGQLPDWYSSQKPDPKSRGDWYQRLAVRKAFRTAGLVRGPHPYSLIVDDLQLDAKVHRYHWGMALPDDVVLGSAKVTSTAPNASEADVILDESTQPDLKAFLPSDKPRHLLVRVLSASQLSDKAATVGKLSIPNPPQRNMEVNKLHITSDSVSPGFKMLLFPYKTGEPLPKTAWNADRTAVTIAWAGQSDVVTFRVGQDGRTRFRIARNGGEVVEVR